LLGGRVLEYGSVQSGSRRNGNLLSGYFHVEEEPNKYKCYFISCEEVVRFNFSRTKTLSKWFMKLA
jgi:hypothetical protein